MRGLYAILDVTLLDARGIDVVAAARAIALARPACVQLRAKDAGSGRTLALLRALRSITREAGSLLFANDRPDLALLAECDGVHVGQDDVPPALVKHLAAEAGRELLVGRSTHNREELARALDEPIDYVAIGPVATTASKTQLEPVLGVAEARSLAEQAKRGRPGLPVCAIGGIDAGMAEDLRTTFDLVAVISALLGPDHDPRGISPRAAAFSNLFASNEATSA